MRKIKILRIIARLNIGGPAIHAILLTEGLDKSRFQSLLIYGSLDTNEGDMLYYAAQKQLRPIFISELKRQLGIVTDIIALKKIYKIIKTVQPDIIHTHTAKAGTLGRIAGILYNFLYRKQTLLVHTFHGHVFEGYFSKFPTRVFLLIERFLAIFTDRIITVSNSLKNELIALGICKAQKIEIIPLGLELEKFFQVPLKNQPSLNIGIVGRLVAIKNHRLFLEAAVKVIDNNPHPQLRFKIIGDGELRRDLEEYADKLGIKRQVDFLGWQKDLVSVYAGLDIVALTSINEGTPVSLIEAMASARAVVATDAGGVKDLLGEEIEPVANFKILERGLMVSRPDPESFAAALIFILQNDALRKKTVEVARSFVKDRFTKERLIKDIEDLYIKLILSTKNSPRA